MCKRKGYGESSLRWMVSHYRVAARQRGLPFTITAEEGMVLLAAPCHYCGTPPSKVFGRKGGYGECVYNGVDRVDNERGYEAGNVVSCCTDCNLAKGTMSGEQYLALVLRVSRHQGWTSVPERSVPPRVSLRHTKRAI